MLLQQVNTHLHHLAEWIDDHFTYDSRTFIAEHELLEDELAEFVKDFKKNRKEVFKVTEYLIDKEETVRRLNLVSK
jgi:hypothetical protein